MNNGNKLINNKFKLKQINIFIFKFIRLNVNIK